MLFFRVFRVPICNSQLLLYNKQYQKSQWLKQEYLLCLFLSLQVGWSSADPGWAQLGLAWLQKVNHIHVCFFLLILRLRRKGSSSSTFPNISSSRYNGKITRRQAILGKAISSLAILFAASLLISYWTKSHIQAQSQKRRPLHLS